MGVGVEFKRDETHVYTWLIHCVVQQRLTQYSKATIPQLKRKKKANQFLSKKKMFEQIILKFYLKLHFLI